VEDGATYLFHTTCASFLFDPLSVYIFYPLSALIPNIMGGHLLFRVTRFDSCVMPWFPFGQGGLTSLVLNVCWGSSMCVSLLM
jgi:hypothetical protein